MNLRHLKEMINDLPEESLDKEVVIDGGEIVYSKFKLEPVSGDDEMTIIGYMITEDRQLKLPF